eukprot:jgi/Botrbrau1/19604/Bobra.0035s0082.1
MRPCQTRSADGQQNGSTVDHQQGSSLTGSFLQPGRSPDSVRTTCKPPDQRDSGAIAPIGVQNNAFNHKKRSRNFLSSSCEGYDRSSRSAGEETGRMTSFEVGRERYRKNCCSRSRDITEARNCGSSHPLPPSIEADPRTAAFFDSLPAGMRQVNYELLQVAGKRMEGGYGAVTRVSLDNKIYALKEAKMLGGLRLQSPRDLYRRLQSKNPETQRLSKCFDNATYDLLPEATLLIQCQNLEGILKFEGVVTIDEPCDRVMGFLTEYCPRGDLTALFRGPKITYGQKINLALELAHILDGLHGHGVVHGDIKPDNVFVANDGSLRLGDFGCAFYWANPPGKANQKRGALYFRAPEVLDGALPSRESDVFAYGEVLHQLMHEKPRLVNYKAVAHKAKYKEGEIFYSGGPPKDWPPEWTSLVVKCMAFLPQDRPSLSDVIAQLSDMKQRHPA